MPDSGARSSAHDGSSPPSAPSWRFVDRFGTEWRIYDRVRWAPSATRAEFRFVPPGHRDTRSRLFIRPDRVQFELRSDDPAWAGFSPVDLSDRTLNCQLYLARRAGPLLIPTGTTTTLALEMRRFERDFSRGGPSHSGDRIASPRNERGSRHVATHARPSGREFRVLSPCSPLAAREIEGFAGHDF